MRHIKDTCNSTIRFIRTMRTYTYLNLLYIYIRNNLKYIIQLIQQRFKTPELYYYFHKLRRVIKLLKLF